MIYWENIELTHGSVLRTTSSRFRLLRHKMLTNTWSDGNLPEVRNTTLPPSVFVASSPMTWQWRLVIEARAKSANSSRGVLTSSCFEHHPARSKPWDCRTAAPEINDQKIHLKNNNQEICKTRRSVIMIPLRVDNLLTFRLPESFVCSYVFHHPSSHRPWAYRRINLIGKSLQDLVR